MTLKELEKLIITPNEGAEQIDAPTGFQFKSTPVHGHLHTADHITSKIPCYMRTTQYSRAGMYEEDCDWCIPIVVHREKFSERIQKIALETFYNWHPHLFESYFGEKPTESFKLKELKKEQAYNKIDQRNYRIRSAFGDWHENVPKGHIGVYANRLKDGYEIMVIIPEQDRNELGIIPHDHNYMPFKR